LSWVRLDGAEACLSASALAAAVEKRLGRKVFLSASEADLNIEGSIGPRSDGPGYRATLRLTDREGAALGTRDVDSEVTDCAAIDEQLALVVSVMIDPDAPPPEPVPEPPPKVERKIIEKKIIEKRTIVKRVKVVREPEPDPIHWELSAAFMTTLGFQPVVGLGVAPAFVIELPHLFGLLAEGGVAVKSSVEAESGGYTAEAAFMHGALAICPLIAHHERLSALGCAGWLAGGFISNGEGFEQNHENTAVITGPWIEGRFSVRIVGPVGLMTSVGAVVPVTHVELYYSSPAGEESLYKTWPVAGIADIGVNVRVP
jgi:hypothetical protein